MNRDLAKYIRSLKDEVSKNIWLDAIARSGRNGTVNLIYKDILIENRITNKIDLRRYFNPKEAESLEIIKILIDTDAFISLNFSKNSKRGVGSDHVKLAKKIAKEAIQEHEQKTQSPELTTTTTVSTTEVVALKPKEFLTEIPKNYTPSGALLRSVIGDWALFYKMLQINNAALIGKTLTLEQIANPNITDEDGKHLKDLCKIFATQQGIVNEDMIKRCFHQVYKGWDKLDDFIQTGFTPRLIKSNINKIMLQLQKQKHGNKTKRESAVEDKINRAGQKDYTELANSRKKGD